MERTKVVCPDCGPQEYRAHLSPVYVHRDPETGDVVKTEYSTKTGVARFNDDDDTCPKCGSETLPQAAAESALALFVRSHAEQFRVRDNYRSMRRGFRVVAG